MIKSIKGRLAAMFAVTTLVLVLAPLANAQSPVVNFVSAGGPDACVGFGLNSGCDKNFSFVAKKFADGTMRGQYTDRFAGGQGAGLHAVLDCVEVRDNNAWVSGTITNGHLANGFDLTGVHIYARVEDNGTSANDAADKISFTFLLLGYIPCTTAFEDPPFLFETRGQVIVR